jgi:hypothetical protein
MTTGPTSQCGTCVNFTGPFSDRARPGVTGPSCDAFPDGIPPEVFGNVLDHRQPVAGDHGIQWASRDGLAFPEWALAANAPR